MSPSGDGSLAFGVALGPSLEACVAHESAWRRASRSDLSSVWLHDRSPSPEIGPDAARSLIEELARFAGPRFGILAGAGGAVDAILAELPARLGAWGVPARIGLGQGWQPGLAQADDPTLLARLVHVLRHARRRPEGRSSQALPTVMVGGLSSPALTLALTHGAAWGAAAAPIRLARARKRVLWLARSLGRSAIDIEGVAVVPVHLACSRLEARRLREHPERLAPGASHRALHGLVIGVTAEVRERCRCYREAGLARVVFEPVLPPSPAWRVSGLLDEQMEAIEELIRPETP